MTGAGDRMLSLHHFHFIEYSRRIFNIYGRIIKMNTKDRNYIYVVLSRTPSKFAWAIRTFGRINYNHASIAFDSDLKELWSFARKMNNLPIDAGVVREFPERFTLNKVNNIPIRIYRVPVNPRQYNLIRNRVMELHNDMGYHYNIFSALLYPIAGGFKTDRAYTCSEFVSALLDEYTDVAITRPCEAILPEELHEILETFLVYDGNLLDYREFEPVESSFFDYVSPWKVVAVTVTIFAVMAYRGAGRRTRELSSLRDRWRDFW